MKKFTKIVINIGIEKDEKDGKINCDGGKLEKENSG